MAECKTCRFYVAPVHDDLRRALRVRGTCHRSPPIVMAWPREQGVPAAEWAEVSLSDWCGEYTKKEDGNG